MAIAVTWIQGVLRIGTGSSSSPRIQTREDAAYSREEFPAALAQGLVQAGVKPDEVFLSTDSPLVIPLMEEIPPATPAIAAKLIQRRAEKAKVFNEPVETGRTLEAGTVTGGPQRFLVHVTPAEWVRRIDRELDARGYHLAGFFPAALALGPVLEKLPGDPNEVVLLAVDAESGLLQVLGRRNGAILFYRTLAGSDERGEEGLVREFRRMALFAEQRRGVKVREIYLSGSRAQQALTRLGPLEDLRIAGAGMPVEPATYLRWLMRQSPGKTDNLVPQAIAMRTRVRRLRIYINLGLLAFAGAGLMWLAGRVVDRGWKIEELRRTRDQQARAIRDMQGGQQDLVKFARDREILRILQEETVANVPELIYRDLPVLLPAALELTAVRIWLEEKSAGSATPQAVWKVEMTGRTIQPNTPVVTPVNQFLERLKDAPWKMSIEATSLEDKAKVPIPDFARGAGKFYILAELR
jgi:hypothetical protein